MEDASTKTYYGKDCPKGMVQVEFVISHSEKYSDYGWKPAKSASLDIYVDGKRFLIKVGDFHDGNSQRRGLHIIGPIDLCCEKTSINACSIFRDSTG